MRRRLIHKQGLPHWKFFMSYFIDSWVFCIVFDDLFLNWMSMCVQLHKIKGLDTREIALPKGKTWWTWHITSIISEKEPHALQETHLKYTWKEYQQRVKNKLLIIVMLRVHLFESKKQAKQTACCCWTGRKRRGSRPSHFERSSSSVARSVLKGLEQLKLIEKDSSG